LKSNTILDKIQICSTEREIIRRPHNLLQVADGAAEEADGENAVVEVRAEAEEAEAQSSYTSPRDRHNNGAGNPPERTTKKNTRNNEPSIQLSEISPSQATSIERRPRLSRQDPAISLRVVPLGHNTSPRPAMPTRGGQAIRRGSMPLSNLLNGRTSIMMTRHFQEQVGPANSIERRRTPLIHRTHGQQVPSTAITRWPATIKHPNLLEDIRAEAEDTPEGEELAGTWGLTGKVNMDIQNNTMTKALPGRGAKISIIHRWTKDLTREEPAPTRIRVMTSMVANILTASTRWDIMLALVIEVEVLGSTHNRVKVGSQRVVTTTEDQMLHSKNVTTERREEMTSTAAKTSLGTIPEVATEANPSALMILKQSTRRDKGRNTVTAVAVTQ